MVVHSVERFSYCSVTAWFVSATAETLQWPLMKAFKNVTEIKYMHKHAQIIICPKK